MGTIIPPDGNLDLLTLYTVQQVKNMLLGGVLYDFIMGRTLTILDPKNAATNLSLTDEQYAFINHAGFCKGFLSIEDLKAPFRFNSDGYLQVDVTDLNLNVTATIDTTLLATSLKQDLLFNKVSDAYSVENVINTKLDLISTSTNQLTLYNLQQDAYSVEKSINTKLDLLYLTSERMPRSEFR